MESQKTMFIDLIQKYMEMLVNGREYKISYGLLKKINDSILDDTPGSVKLDLEKISKITDEEMSIFSSDVCRRIVLSTRQIALMEGLRPDTILKTIYKLRDDLVHNKLNSLKKQDENLVFLLDVINNELYKDNYNLLLGFIKDAFENEMLSLDDAICLNFYLLKKCNDYSLEKKVSSSTSIISMKENVGSVLEIRIILEVIFNKYGYVYDRTALDRCGGEDIFVKYVNVDYVDYILSMFNKYGVTQRELYVKKTFYNIVIDNDKETFDTILDFVDKNNCSLGKLLFIPAIFARGKKVYVMKDRTRSSHDTGDFRIEIDGCNEDFFKNLNLYKKITGLDNISDLDLERLGLYICTSNVLVEKNMKVLVKYGLLKANSFPNDIISLCGKKVEYLIDRFIESSLYDSLLLSINKRTLGSSLLFFVNSPFMFYKIKRAYDLGETVFQSDSIRKIFYDDNEDYMGIKLIDGQIIQEPIPMSVIDSIDSKIKKWLPDIFYSDNDKSWDNIAMLEFNNLYKYKIFSPVDIFINDDVKGELFDRIFKEDYDNVYVLDDVLDDEYIKLLDNAIYCDKEGNTKKLKTSDLKYEFSHYKFPNLRVIISRYKVLRLCKLLKENDCWISSNFSLIDKENVLLSVIMKDSVMCDYEKSMLRFLVRMLLCDGLIKDNNINMSEGDFVNNA